MIGSGSVACLCHESDDFHFNLLVSIELIINYYHYLSIVNAHQVYYNAYASIVNKNLIYFMHDNHIESPWHTIICSVGDKNKNW